MRYKNLIGCFNSLTSISDQNRIFLYNSNAISVSFFLIKVLDESKPMEEVPEWFHGAHLNFAENLLRFDDEKVALYTAGAAK